MAAQTTAMSMYVLRNLPPGLIGRAQTRARELGEPLPAILIRWLTAFADGTDAQSAQRPAAQRTNAALTADQRREKAQRAAAVRWANR